MSPLPSASANQTESPELSIAVQQLHEEVRVLRMAIDELRDDVVWAARQVLSAGYETSPSQMPRRPVDPLAPDADYQYREPNSHSSPEISESTPYCCDSPRLSWSGNPEAPGVTCENCGYVIAEQGDLVQRDDQSVDVNSLSQPLNGSSAEKTADTGIPPSSPSSTTLDSPVTASATAPVNPIEHQAARTRNKRQPLHLRIYQQPLLTEIVRAVGYAQLPREEVLRRLEPLRQKYGPERTIEGARELLAQLPGGHDIWALTDDSRRWSRALLGPPPLETAAVVSEVEVNPLAEKKSESESPAEDSPRGKLSEVKASRKVVLARFREHLDATGEVAADVPDDIQRLLGARGRLIPDLILGDGPPHELLAVRRTLSAVQRHDMQEWLEVSDFGEQATRAWPRETDDGWKWAYEVVATRQDGEDSEIEEGWETANASEDEPN